MSEDNATPTYADVFDAVIGARLADLHTAMPGVVLSFSGTSGRATVQPSLKYSARGEDGKRIVRSRPAIANVPCLVLRGGQARITMPIAAGDPALLVFAEQSLDRWKARSGVVDPVDFRRFDMTDAIALVGLSAPGPIPTDRMTIGYENGPKIHLGPTSIRLGSNSASRGVARVADVIRVNSGDLAAAIEEFITTGFIVTTVEGEILTGTADVLG